MRLILSGRWVHLQTVPGFNQFVYSIGRLHSLHRGAGLNFRNLLMWTFDFRDFIFSVNVNVLR
jgi:hypothetical protein